MSEEIKAWGARERLAPETIQFVEEKGITTLNELRHFTGEEIQELFQELPKAKFMLLKKAIGRLSSDQAPASGLGQPKASIPQRQDKPAGATTVPEVSRELDALDLSEQTGYGLEKFRLLLVGKTGSGKSTTGNTICGDELFNSDVSFGSITTARSLVRKERNGKFIEIMDCPGLYDTKKTQEEISTVIVQAVACMHPGPHAVLYVVKIDRYTAEEYGAYQRLKALFDDTITDYIIVVFTGGDELEKKKKTFEDLMKNAPEHLKIVLKECGNRCIVFNNFAPDPQPQIDRLFEVIRQMKHANGKPYSCPKYEEIGESVEQEVARRLAVVDKKELERQKYVQELQKKTEAAEEEVRKQKEENEKKEQERQRQLEEEVKKRKEEVEKLKKQLEEQKMSEERKIQEVRTLQKHLERERQQFLLQLEEQRRKDREEMERREEKRAELEEKRREEEIEAMERERLRYEKELNSLKDMIAEEKEPGFIGKSVRFVSAPVRYVYNALEKL